MTERPVKSDADILALLHKENINQGFLSSLGEPFLRSLYIYLIKKELVIISRDGNIIMGFVSYSYESSGIIKRFIISRPQVIFTILFSLIKRPSLIRSVFETMKAPGKSNGQLQLNEILPTGELLSITVDPKYQNSGTGTILLNALESELKRSGIKSYKVIAGECLAGANRFYQKKGFCQVGTINIHGESLSNLYIKNI
jgi:GNAT superfamily N-acetyltransferase